MEISLISCIVPVFNGERYLGEALDSILGQTHRPLEIIVADDGSTDRTATVAAGYGDQIRYLYQPNAGTASACNLGLGAARGGFIAFLAADDLWHPEKLMRQMVRFRERPELLDSRIEGRSRAVSGSSDITTVTRLRAADSAGATRRF